MWPDGRTERSPTCLYRPKKFRLARRRRSSHGVFRTPAQRETLGQQRTSQRLRLRSQVAHHALPGSRIRSSTRARTPGPEATLRRCPPCQAPKRASRREGQTLTHHRARQLDLLPLRQALRPEGDTSRPRRPPQQGWPPQRRQPTSELPPLQPEQRKQAPHLLSRQARRSPKPPSGAASSYMPQAKPCATQGCGHLTPLGQPHCPRCNRTNNRRRHAKAQANGLQTSHWQQTRQQRLELDRQTCQRCGAQATNVHLDPALHGNHRLASIETTLSLCHRCHGTIDAPRSAQRGGGHGTHRARPPRASHLVTESGGRV